MDPGHVEEPELVFGQSSRSIDPRVGLILHGPASIDQVREAGEVIQAAAIGTEQAVGQLRSFLTRLREVIPLEQGARDDAWKLPFPGVGADGPLGFDIALQPGLTVYVRDQEERNALEADDRTERIKNLTSLYKEKIDSLAQAGHPQPDIVFFPLSRRALERCKNPQMEEAKIVSESEYFSPKIRGIHSYRFDFHHVLKVLAFRHRFPSQVVRPSTLRFTRQGEDDATIAWNIVAAAYYKATGFPWKLADFDPGTCHVGISFYWEHDPDSGRRLRTSMAHVHMRTAESQVIRGSPLPESSEQGKSPELSEEDAAELLQDVVSLYDDLEGHPPRRIVVHQTAPIKEPEVAGLQSEAPDSADLDLLHVRTRRVPKFFHRGHDYPPVRGTLVTGEGDRFFVFTTGYIPALDTYPGSTTPNPLEVNPARLDTNPRRVAEDLLSLTKLDWNTTAFARREPVTISVSRKVGHILSEMRAQGTSPPQPYRFYM